MKKLILLIGNIGTGKSTLAKDLQKDGYIIIARDSLRYGIGAGNYIFNSDYEKTIWETEKFMFKHFIRLDVPIVVDEVGITKSMRARYIPYAKRHDYKVEAIVMPKLTMKEAVKRRLNNPHGQSDKKLWETVWKKFDIGYEEPEYNEGFNKIIRLTGL